jgi:hypothetical protein
VQSIARQQSEVSVVKHHHNPSDYETFIEELKASQQNLTWPSTLVNSRGADTFILKGSPNPTVVQRIAAWLFGLFWMGLGSVWFAGTVSTHNKHDKEGVWITTVIGVPCFLLGIWIFRNGFPRRLKPAKNSSNKAG